MDASDLVTALGLKSVVIGGWSLGGFAAQIALSLFPDKISHVVLIGTLPPAPLVKLAEQLFYDTAVIENYNLEDEVILFFEPKSKASRAAAQRSHDRIAARKNDRSKPVPAAWAASQLGPKPIPDPFPAPALLQLMKTTSIPILHIAGDHDIACPVENWYALNQQLPTLRLVTYPSSGHGPQHEHPKSAALQIATFVEETQCA